MNRRILTIVVGDAVELPQWAVMPTMMACSELVELLLKPAVLASDNTENWTASDFQFFDWSGQPLSSDTKVGEVPLPGILLAANPASNARLSRALETDLWLFRHTIIRDETSADRLARFLSSPDAARPPAPLKRSDVFISYSFEDSPLAATIVEHLESRGLEVFIAESSLNTSTQWREQIRDAVMSSRSAVLLITGASVESTWVLAEAGALASQRTPTIILFDGIQPHEIPPPLQHVALTEPASNPERWLDLAERHVRPSDAEQT